MSAARSRGIYQALELEPRDGRTMPAPSEANKGLVYYDKLGGLRVSDSDNWTELARPGATTVVLGSSAAADFKDLDEALRWAVGAGGANAWLNIHVEPGTYYFGRERITYFNTPVYFLGLSGNKADVIFTAQPDMPDSNFTAIEFLGGGIAQFYYLTIDATAGGWAQGGSRMIALSARYSAYVYTWGVAMQNCRKGLYVSQNAGAVFGGGNCLVANCETGIESAWGGQCHISGTAVNNSDMGLSISAGGRIVGVPSFSGNTADYNVAALNEIQYDGGYITDAAGPMSFKA